MFDNDNGRTCLYDFVFHFLTNLEDSVGSSQTDVYIVDTGNLHIKLLQILETTYKINKEQPIWSDMTQFLSCDRSFPFHDDGARLSSYQFIMETDKTPLYWVIVGMLVP